MISNIEPVAPFYEDFPENSLYEIELGDSEELLFGDIQSKEDETVSVQLFVNEIEVISADCQACPV